MTKAKKSISEKALEFVEKQIQKAPETKVNHWEAWRLRIQGYTVAEVAQVLGCTQTMVYKHYDWVMKNHPMPGMEEFLRLSLDRLEWQYRQLEAGRAAGDTFAQMTSLKILDQQAKLLGAYTMKIDTTSKVTYQLEGVDLDAV